MSGLTIADLDQAVLADLEQLAQASGRSPDEVARTILTQVLASPSGRRIRADLIRLWQSSGATVLYVTHNISEAVQLSDRILLMYERPTKVYRDVREIRADRRLIETRVVVCTADAAMADELGARRRDLVDLEFVGVAEMLVDDAAALGGDRDLDLDRGRLVGQRLHLALLGDRDGIALGLDLGLIGLARGEVVFDVHRHHLLGGEFGAAVFAEQADGVGAALPAMTHHVHLAFAGILQRLQLPPAQTPQPEFRHRPQVRRVQYRRQHLLRLRVPAP